MIAFTKANLNSTKDLDALADILQSAFLDEYKREDNERFYRLKRATVYFILHEGERIGTFTLRNIMDYVGLSSFAIKPKYQGKGYGREVIYTLLDQYPNLAVIDLPRDTLVSSIYKGLPILYR